MITTDDVVAMVSHWLSTPKNAYFGQNYGQDLKRELLKNTNDFNADRLIAEMKKDIPILATLSDNQLGIVVQHGVDEHGVAVGSFERVRVVIQVFGVPIPISE